MSVARWLVKSTENCCATSRAVSKAGAPVVVASPIDATGYLSISFAAMAGAMGLRQMFPWQTNTRRLTRDQATLQKRFRRPSRADERRGGEASVRACRSRGARD